MDNKQYLIRQLRADYLFIAGLRMGMIYALRASELANKYIYMFGKFLMYLIRVLIRSALG